MKKLIVLIIMLVLVGCAAQKYTIPDEPEYKAFTVQTEEDGIHLDWGDFETLVENVGRMNEYAEKMRKLLEDHNNK